MSRAEKPKAVSEWSEFHPNMSFPALSPQPECTDWGGGGGGQPHLCQYLPSTVETTVSSVISPNPPEPCQVLTAVPWVSTPHD